MARLTELADELTHIHVASTNRLRLKHIGRVGKRRFGLSIREFPPFEPVDNVHAATSWHYRSSRNPWVARSYANRGNGLALDASGPRQRQFFEWVLHRYGRPSNWFQP